MVARAHRPMPEVKGFSSHRMEIPSTRDLVEMKLMDWIQQVLGYIGHSAAMDGVHPATYLTANADGIDTIMHAPTAMNLGPRTVYADFAWGRRPNGNWYLRHVKFGLHLGQAQLN